jgi:hypothetical protein
MWKQIAWVLLFILVFVFICVLPSRPSLRVGDPLPDYLAWPRETYEDYTKQKLYTTEWGSIHHDGPSKLMPNHCYWYSGKLFCRSLI